MRNIKTEIEQYMTELTKKEQTLTSHFVFPPEFIGFHGHFPSKKVLPGACQIQCALSTIEKGNERSAALKEIVLAKYMVPVFPDEEVTCFVSRAPDEGGEAVFKALFTKGGSKVAEMKLLVSLKSGKKKQQHA